MAHYEKLLVWSRAVDIATNIYKITRVSKNFSNDFGLRDQIRRSIVSISSNIAEGSERESKVEFIRYLMIARGSLAESRTQLLIAKNIEYISDDEHTTLDQELTEIQKMLNALISSLRNK